MPAYGHTGTNAEHPAHWRDDHFLLKKRPMLPELELELYVVDYIDSKPINLSDGPVQKPG